MNVENLDVVELLEKKQVYHIEQLKRIKLALSALKGETEFKKGTAITSKNIQWTKEVMKLFNESDRGMTLVQIRNKLFESGIPEAMDDKYRPTIYSTLTRGVDKGVLEKAGYGLYRKKPSKAGLLLRKIDNPDINHE